MASIRHRLTISFVTLALLILTSAASALSINPTRQFNIGVKKIREEVVERRLSGPGSSPPTCRSKCGDCTPCEAVHVPIRPGWTIPLEYYPEAWRCKCGNSIFLP